MLLHSGHVWIRLAACGQALLLIYCSPFSGHQYCLVVPLPLVLNLAVISLGINA